MPHIIVSDYGPSFVTSEFKELCGKLGIKHITTALYHLSLNGAAKRVAQEKNWSNK